MTPPSPTAPFSADLLLVGGGHAHVEVLRRFAMTPEPGLRLTLLAKEIEAPYSGMLPGYVAGVYDHAACHIDLVQLAAAAGARVIHGAMDGLDVTARRAHVAGRPPLGFDLLSLDVGVTPKTEGVAGARDHALAVKPVSTFAAGWARLNQQLRDAATPSVLIVGGGAAGFELALAVRRRLGRGAHVGLAAGGGLLATLSARARRLARAALIRADIDLIEGDRVVAVDRNRADFASGRRRAVDGVLISATAEAPGWLRETGLRLDADGFVAVGAPLESLGAAGIFAAGDCASIQGAPRPKAGVFAVRQGPPLADNLRRAFRGEALRPHAPQSRYLSLLSTSDGRAIATRGSWAAEGRWVWRWKDRIDRAFMDRYRDLASMAARGARNEGAAEDGMRCGGCAAKLGPAALTAALARLDGGAGPAAVRDDAAVTPAPDGRAVRLDSVDFFRSFWPDPYLLGRIAAVHALGDVFAMGGRPQAAQAICVLPHATPRILSEDLFQLTAGMRDTLRAEGATLLGGHSAEGAEMAVGLAVSGAATAENLMRKSGLKPGDRLILTKPIGAGVVFAAAMRGAAPGPAVMAALAGMRRSNAGPAGALAAAGVRAATDVTGFGLAGHLMEMLDSALEGEGLDAEIDLAVLPLYPGALALARAGVASSLLPDNLALASRLVGPSGADIGDAGETQGAAGPLTLLFDPQTAGGLLAGVPGDRADATLAAVRAAGAPDAALIGRVAQRAETAPRLRLTGALASR